MEWLRSAAGIEVNLRNCSLPCLLTGFVIVLWIGLPAFPVAGQELHLGIKGGVPVTDYYQRFPDFIKGPQTSYSSATRRYTVGVTGELRFAHGLGLEVDAMYHRIGYSGSSFYSSSASGEFRQYAIHVNGHSWEYPVLAKYRFGHGVSPFAAGGMVFRYIGPVHARGVETVGTYVTNTSVTRPFDTREPTDVRKGFYFGLAAGMGLEVPLGRVRLLPEFRYTRWLDSGLDLSRPMGIASHQAEFLVGILF